ncbi:MAG: restriction endonuclease subunit S [Acidobacteria bacterium]|nr:restriction endonuclease subunit S [Acidobacteriota bacterium]
MRRETFFEKFDQFADAPDAVAKMRELILQLAVQGRLVGPADNDEPVEDSLRRMWADKSGNRAEITDAEKAQPFELPAHWRWVVLAEVAEFSIGKTPPRGDSSYWYPEDHSWVSIADMKHYGTITETKEKVSTLAAQEVFRQRFAEPGSILMSFKLTIGKVARAGIRCFHNEAIISMQPPEPELLDYLFRFLPIFAALQTSNNAIKGNTLNKGLLTSLPIAFPPLAEQKRIVAKVDELMALCDRLEAQQQERETRHAALARASLARFADAPTPANLNFIFHKSYAIPPADLRKSILALAVQGKLVPQDPNDESAESLLANVNQERLAAVKAKRISPMKLLPPVEDDEVAYVVRPGWALARLIELVLEIQTGPFGSSLHQSDYQVGGTPVINPASLKDGKIVPIEEMAIGPDTLKRLAVFRLNEGDIVMARRGEMGRCAIVTKTEDGWLCGTGSLVLRMPAGLYAPFLALLIGAPEARAYLGGASVGATMQNLNQGILAKMALGVPPLAEQRRIVAKVEQLMALVGELETQLVASSATGANLLAAVVGELTSKD